MIAIDKDYVRALLPEQMITDFDDICEQRVLGASTHIRMIGNMIEAIANDSIQDASIDSMLMRIDTVCQFFIATRGEASQAIGNAIYLMTTGLHTYDANMPVKQVAEMIIQVKNAYYEKNQRDIEQCVSYAVEIGNRMSHIMLYDYSSTVELFVKKLTPGKLIYIPESRVINGGKPYIKACIAAGHHIHFIPDASIMYYMKDCDGAFMGAESIYPDGTGFNTTGSDLVGLLCDYYKKPLYFISPLIKLDERPVYGKEKTIVFKDLKDVLGCDIDVQETNAIEYRTPELLGVCPEHIKAFITEKGVIPSTQLYDIALHYIKELRGEKGV